jgi:hypothetical protein
MRRQMSFMTAWRALITGVLAAAVLTSAAPAADGKITVTEKSFGCMTQITPVRGFFVGNLLGDEQGTLKVARSKTGGVYPPGSVVQLVPTEVMVKQPVGFNAVTRDWRFFELEASMSGTVHRLPRTAQRLCLHALGIKSSSFLARVPNPSFPNCMHSQCCDFQPPRVQKRSS